MRLSDILDATKEKNLVLLKDNYLKVVSRYVGASFDAYSELKEIETVLLFILRDVACWMKVTVAQVLLKLQWYNRDVIRELQGGNPRTDWGPFYRQIVSPEHPKRLLLNRGGDMLTVYFPLAEDLRRELHHCRVVACRWENVHRCSQVRLQCFRDFRDAAYLLLLASRIVML